MKNKLIEEMELDNGVEFCPTKEQSERLDELLRLYPLTDDEIDVLTAGEQSEQQALEARSPLVAEMGSILEAIFNGECHDRS